MQIVIDIPENDYNHVREHYEKNEIVEATYAYIYHGTVLPKNHGRLIDLDALCDEHLSGCYIELEEHEISEIPVIIEGTEGKE